MSMQQATLVKFPMGMAFSGDNKHKTRCLGVAHRCEATFGFKDHVNAYYLCPRVGCENSQQTPRAVLDLPESCWYTLPRGHLFLADRSSGATPPLHHMHSCLGQARQLRATSASRSGTRSYRSHEVGLKKTRIYMSLLVKSTVVQNLGIVWSTQQTAQQLAGIGTVTKYI